MRHLLILPETEVAGLLKGFRWIVENSYGKSDAQLEHELHYLFDAYPAFFHGVEYYLLRTVKEFRNESFSYMDFEVIPPSNSSYYSRDFLELNLFIDWSGVEAALSMRR